MTDVDRVDNSDNFRAGGGIVCASLLETVAGNAETRWIICNDSSGIFL